MIKKRELMLGNLVGFKQDDDNDYRIVSVDELFFQRYDEATGTVYAGIFVIGIPVTEERLFALGFEINTVRTEHRLSYARDEEGKIYTHKRNQNINIYRFDWFWIGSNGKREREKGEFMYWDADSGVTPVPYIHKLQNVAYLLTGEELQLQEAAV